MYCSPPQVALALNPNVQAIVVALTGVTHLYANFFEGKIHPPFGSVNKSPSGRFAHNDFNWRDWVHEIYPDYCHDLFIQLIFYITPLEGVREDGVFMVWSGLHHKHAYMKLVEALKHHVPN